MKKSQKLYHKIRTANNELQNSISTPKTTFWSNAKINPPK